MTDKNYYTALTLMFATTAGIFLGLATFSGELAHSLLTLVTSAAAGVSHASIPREVPGAPVEDPRSVLAAARR